MLQDPVIVFATFRPLPNMVDDTMQVLQKMVVATRAEAGNERYDLYAAESDDGRTFHLFERYRDQGALQAHRDSAHYLEYRATIQELLKGPIEVHILSVIDADNL